MIIEYAIPILVSLCVLCVFVFLTYMNIKFKKEAYMWRTKHDTMLSQKKSSEVRVGKIGENMAPFLTDWPYDPNNFRFLGNPVDGIQVNDDAIILIEIKTGNSRLSKTQKRAKELVKEGKVYFETFRISEDGCTLKRAERIEHL